MNTNETNNTTTLGSIASLVTLPPLSFGEHRAAIISYDQVKTSSNNKEYITISFKFDNENVLRKKACFQQDLIFLGQGIGQQFGIYGDIFTQLNEAIATGQMLTVNVVEKTDEVNGKTYVNWQYAKIN